MERLYYVYVVASRSRTIYVGVTNDLDRRIAQHREGVYDGFSKRYRCDRLVWFERYVYVQAAIAREKQLKRWRREKKLFLIERENPTWADLYAATESRGGYKRVPPLRSG